MITSQRTSELKALFKLRTLLCSMIAREIGAPFKWNPKSIRIVSAKIEAAAGYRLSDRAIRMTVSEEITSRTKIPRKDNDKSRLDALSMVVGYRSFRQFMLQEAAGIQALQLQTSVKSIQTSRMSAAREIVFYSLAGEGTDASQLSAGQKEKFMVAHYYTDLGTIYSALITLHAETSTAVLETYLLPYEPNADLNPHTLLYSGTFKEHSTGYLDLLVRSPSDPSVMLFALFYTNLSAFNFKFIYGTYAAKSLVTQGCYSGKVIGELFDTKEEALVVYKSDPTPRLGKLLNDTLLQTPQMAFYSLEEMERFKPAVYAASG